MKIDLSGMTSLTTAHLPEIRRMAKQLAQSPIADQWFRDAMAEVRKSMYVDDYPGLRGESQMKYVTYRTVLELRGKK